MSNAEENEAAQEQELEQAWRDGKEEERHACLAIVRAQGCNCKLFGRARPDQVKTGEGDWHFGDCPVALLAAIEARGKEGR